MQSGSEAVRVLERCREGVLTELAGEEQPKRRAHLQQVLTLIEQALHRLGAQPPSRAA